MVLNSNELSIHRHNVYFLNLLMCVVLITDVTRNYEGFDLNLRNE